MQARASQDTLSALLLLAQYGQAFETGSGEWKVKGTDQKIPQKQMSGLLILGYVRQLSASVRLKPSGKTQLVDAIRQGRLPQSAKAYVASKNERRSARYSQ